MSIPIKQAKDYPQTSEWTPRRIEQGIGGTAALGAGLGLLSILYDQVRSNRRKQMADKGRVLEDTLTISPTALGKLATLTEWTEGLAAGAGAYLLIQKAYQAIREKQLAAEVGEADDQYTQALTQSAAKPEKPVKTQFKRAFQGPTFSELFTNLPVKDMLWIPAMAGAVGTYGLMEHVWPRVKEKAEAGMPRRIVVKGFGTVLADGPGNGPLAQLDKARGQEFVKKELQEESAEKAQQPEARNTYRPSWLGNSLAKAATLTAPVGEDDCRCAAGLTAFVLAEQPALKLAHSGMVGLIGAFDRDPEQTERLVKEAGVVAAITLTKGADDHYHNLTVAGRKAAAYNAFGSAVLRPALLALTLAELQEVNPDLSKRAKVVRADPYYGTIMTKIASLTWQADILLAEEAGGLEKSAAAASMAGDMRRQMGTLGISESKDSEGQMDDADPAYSDESDPIDKFLSGESQPAAK